LPRGRIEGRIGIQIEKEIQKKGFYKHHLVSVHEPAWQGKGAVEDIAQTRPCTTRVCEKEKRARKDAAGSKRILISSSFPLLAQK
jgi:hypothetical protein